MEATKKPISKSLELLDANLIDVAQVGEWARLMGYNNTKKFSRRFLRYYHIRPCKALNYLRLKSIYEQLNVDDCSNFQIAMHHSLPDEKALNKYVKYHLGCPPTVLKSMSEQDFYSQVEKIGSKIR